jgi:hypothetical protein
VCGWPERIIASIHGTMWWAFLHQRKVNVRSQICKTEQFATACIHLNTAVFMCVLPCMKLPSARRTRYER